MPARRRILVSILSLLAFSIAAEAGARAWLRWLADDSAFLKYASIAQLQSTTRFNALVVRHSYLGYALKPGYERGANRINRWAIAGRTSPG